LAAIFAGKGIVRQEFIDHLLGGESLAKQFESPRAVPYIYVGLCRDTAGSGLGPRHYGADGKISGRDRDAAISGGGVIGHDREGVDVSRTKRKRRQDTQQDSVHTDSYTVGQAFRRETS
jgi:hypothetical protein